MSLYSFNCQACGTDFESSLKEGEPALRCPKCGSTKVEKKPSGLAGFFQKGKNSFDQCFSWS
ncbi:MAG: hypothetical protein K6U11_08865 [bacterium]|nr:hypothetical protein [bacterium]